MKPFAKDVGASTAREYLTTNHTMNTLDPKSKAHLLRGAHVYE